MLNAFFLLLSMNQKVSGQNITPRSEISREMQTEAGVVKGKKNIVSLFRVPAAVKQPPEQKQ